MLKSENVILQYLDEEELDLFMKNELQNMVPLDNLEFIRGFRSLIQKSQIVNIEKGKYRRRNFTDENAIGCFMASDGGIAYWSALNAHGLTEQFPNKIFVQNTKRRGERSVFGIGATFHFVTVKSKKIIGYKTYGYGNHSFLMTDVGKTIIDCFDLPHYAGGYYEIIKAFNKAELRARKMVQYCKAINNIALVKRLAYLTELLEKPNMEYFLKYAREVLNERYSPFDASLPSIGKYYSKWRLILNMDEEEILEIANPMY